MIALLLLQAAAATSTATPAWKLADRTNAAAASIIETERLERQRKTEPLRKLREAKETARRPARSQLGRVLDRFHSPAMRRLASFVGSR